MTFLIFIATTFLAIYNSIIYSPHDYLTILLSGISLINLGLTVGISYFYSTLPEPPSSIPQSKPPIILPTTPERTCSFQIIKIHYITKNKKTTIQGYELQCTQTPENQATIGYLPCTKPICPLWKK